MGEIIITVVVFIVWGLVAIGATMGHNKGGY